jgi:hypothetical protein
MSAHPRFGIRWVFVAAAANSRFLHFASLRSE